MTPGGRSFHAWIIAVSACLIVGCAAQKKPIVPPVPSAIIDADSLAALADSAASAGQYIEAIDWFKAAIEVDPHHRASLRGLAALHEKTNDPRSARYYFETLTNLDTPDPNDFLGLARVAEHLSDDKGAIAALDKAASLFPNHLDIQYRMGVLHQKRSHLRQAAERFRRAVQINPRSEKALHALGNTEFDLQNYNEARRHLETYLTLDPSDFQSNMRVGYIYFHNGAFDRALPFYRQAVETISASIDARVALASTLEKLGRPQAAIREYETALAKADDLSPLQPVILALADLLNKQHQFEKTVSLLQSLPPEVSRTPGLFCALGIALAGEGNYEDAVNAFENAIGHPQWGSFATNQINKIKNLKSYDKGK